MKRYDLTNNLSMQKLNLETEKDLWLMRKLQSDELVCGENGYLWQENYYHRNTNYLQNEDIYDSPFSIYHYEDPIGYLEVSKIYETSKKSSVYLSGAMIKEARNHGHMRKNITKY